MARRAACGNGPRLTAGDLAALNVVTAGVGAGFVFQHGLCGDAAQPAEIFPDEVPYRLMTLECRGHGRSGAGDPAAFSIARFADDVAAMIEAQAKAPVVVGGISMGAAIALRLAVWRPELVRGLVLVRPAWLIEAAPSNMRAYAEVGALLSSLPPKEALASFDRSETAAWLSREGPANLTSLRGFFSREPVAVTTALLTRISRDGPGVTPEEVGRLRIPALVIGQALDPLHPLHYAEKLAAMIAGAHFGKVTPKADNPAQHIAECREALRGFLISLAPAGERLPRPR